jgi:hypothetical protein
MKNVDWRWVFAEAFSLEELFLLRSVMLKMVCMLEGRNKVGPEEPTDERRGWQNTSA